MELSRENGFDLNTVSLEKQVKDERARLSTDRMDVSYGELINMYKNKELIIRPEYQRLFRWTVIQKTALIESILLGIPVPPIFVAEDEDGIWELVDGLQRMTTIISFFGDLEGELSSNVISQNTMEEESIENLNKWTLESGNLISDLEGFNVDSLPKKYVINIKRAVCRVEILRGESNTAMKYELFKRLNSGGSKLTPQEIRNAIYRGINSKINDLTEELSRNQNFKNLVSISEQKRQELYDQELILRFIAYLNNTEKINSNTEKYLDDFMENAVNNPDFNTVYYKDIFEKVFDLLSKSERNIFKSDRNMFVPAYYEGITIGVAQNYDKYKDNLELLNIRISQLKNDEDYKRYSGSASNSKNRIKNRLRRANEIFALEVSV